MSNQKPAIPDTIGIKDDQVVSVLDALTENVEIVTGRRGTKVAKLGPTSTLAAVINKLNELLDRLQAA